MRKLIPSILGTFVLFALLGSMELSFAKGKEDQKNEPSRQKVIDFDGDLVEGMNKRPFDSLSQISEAEKRRQKAHLYRKRKGFRFETHETLREMRYL